MMETNKTRSGLSLASEHRSMIERFGDRYVEFLNANPTITRRQNPIVDITEAVRNGGMTIVELDNLFGNGSMVWWLKVMLIELLKYLGAFDRVRPMQVENLAKSIRQEYYWMTSEEFSTFVCKFSLGYYGKLYTTRSINPQDITIGLRMYAEELKDVRGQVEAELREKERINKEKEKGNPVSWEEFCRERGIKKKSPLDRIYERIGHNQRDRDK